MSNINELVLEGLINEQNLMFRPGKLFQDKPEFGQTPGMAFQAKPTPTYDQTRANQPVARIGNNQNIILKPGRLFGSDIPRQQSDSMNTYAGLNKTDRFNTGSVPVGRMTAQSSSRWARVV